MIIMPVIWVSQVPEKRRREVEAYRIERNAIVERMVAIAEEPATYIQRGRAMPSAANIYLHWWAILVALEKFDGIEEVAEGACWGCGMYPGQEPAYGVGLQRAHILARTEGGSDRAANLHLLCGVCHSASEGLHGAEYWRWFLQGLFSEETQAEVVRRNPMTFVRMLHSQWDEIDRLKRVSRA